MRTRHKKWLRGRLTVSVIIPALVSLVVGALTAVPACSQARAADKQAEAAEQQAKASRDTLIEMKSRAAVENAPQIFFKCDGRPRQTNQPFPLFLQIINEEAQTQLLSYFFAGDGSDDAVRRNLRGPFVGRCGVRNLGRTSLYDIYFTETINFGSKENEPVKTVTARVTIDSLTPGEEFQFVTTNWSKDAAWIMPAKFVLARSTLSGQQVQVPLRIAAGTVQFVVGPGTEAPAAGNRNPRP